MKINLRFFLLLSISLLALLFGCTREDDFITGGDPLTFSTDTIFFDTVFTELGSATRILKVYNPNDKTIRIPRIYIKDGASSRFRLNIDGIPTNDARDVEIAKEDSLYIFAEVTINPDDPLSVSPFVITDAIEFELEEQTQSVALEAWGQNANYFPGRFNKGSGIILTCGGGEVIWDDPKPYVIYGIVVIDTCNLVITAGTQVYVHGGLASFVDTSGLRNYFNDGRLIIGSAATLDVRGTEDEPVTIQGDRLEPGFSDVPGQWFGIIFGSGSKGNKIEFTEIKNAALGVAVDSAAELTLNNCEIHNMSANGILGIHSTITATNTLVYNSVSTGVRLGYGGDYNFAYCTFASYGVDASALTLSNGLCLDPLCGTFKSNPLNANFTNSIVFGSSKEEIELSDFTTDVDGDFNYFFDHCVVKIDTTNEQFPVAGFLSSCDPCINGAFTDRLFRNVGEDDYHLDSLSIAEEQAIPIPGITLDLETKQRDPVKPDVGCYEWEER